MSDSHSNTIEFKVSGRFALFTDPLTKVGGEKCSYHVPTYEALKGIAKSIYWKPTFIWVIDCVRVMKRIRTQTKGVKPQNYGGGNDLANYTFLADVEYQVRAHFVWNEFQPDLKGDRVDGKHFSIAKRMVERGGRQDIFLGTRDCQGYVEACKFGSDAGYYDEPDELAFGLMFHGFDYPDETGGNEMVGRFWQPVMKAGIIEFLPPERCKLRKTIRNMAAKRFGIGDNLNSVDAEEMEWA